MSLAGSMVVMSCLGCTGLGANASDVINVDVGPVTGEQSFQTQNQYQPVDPVAGAEFRLPLKVGNDFSPSNWAQPEQAARFKELDLSTPLSMRMQPGDNISAEVAFGASGERTGLGLDFQVAPRAQIQSNRAGNNIANVGGEVRLGQGLADRDLRNTDFRPPAWYFFVGADNQALMWNFADKQSVTGVALRDQVTVGDMQAGMAWSTSRGGQMSLGLVERKLSFTDIAGDHDVSTRERFAAFSFTIKR
ncbi:MAG: hypothetical protein GC155_16790 [Alphaproteobacteria bacterium]|nr:hypothetical protein [Alphaproteobacteria bacterium]